MGDNNNNNNNHKRKRKNENDNNDNNDRKKKKIRDDSYDEEEMNTIYNHAKQFKGVMRKYWVQRHNLFSKYDEGIILTKELWFSVTPEKISKFMAEFINDRICKMKGGVGQDIKILDAFCGGGGNVVQFLQVNERNKVYGVDINKTHLECTKNNAMVYCGEEEGVKGRLELLPLDWRYADSEEGEEGEENATEVFASREESMDSLERLQEDGPFDVVFASPPWGGPLYLRQEVYDLERDLLPFPLARTLRVLSRCCSRDGRDGALVVLFLPRNSDFAAVARACTGVFRRAGRRVAVAVEIVRVAVRGHVTGALVAVRVT